MECEHGFEMCSICDDNAAVGASNSTDLLSAENATHLLRCRHAIGQHGKEYYMRCHVLKTMPDGRLKLLVFGERYWKDTLHIEKIRYVSANRVSSR